MDGIRTSTCILINVLLIRDTNFPVINLYGKANNEDIGAYNPNLENSYLPDDDLNNMDDLRMSQPCPLVISKGITHFLLILTN